MQRGFSNIADISAKLFQFWGGNDAAAGAGLASQGQGKAPQFGGEFAGAGVGGLFTGSVSVPGTGATTPADADAIQFDDANFFTLTSSIITIPAGMSRVGISFRAQFPPNATGFRSYFSEKNGSSGLTRLDQRIAATSATIGTTIQSSVYAEVVEGDEFEVFILQDSGSALLTFYEFSIMAFR